MPVRELTDSRGVEWRIWEVTPESIHPQTKAEDHLADCYREGWVVFETVSGSEKRRLCPLPRGWHRLDDSALEALLNEAEIVLTPRQARQSSVRPPAADVPVDRPGAVDLSALGVVRSFLYPGGRVWAVGVVRRDEGAPVLRFASGRRTIDLHDWPAEWADLDDTELVELLRGATPRQRHEQTPDTPRRRYDDQPSDVRRSPAGDGASAPPKGAR